ncbi:TPA: hypothetical protein DCZ46_00240 [Candidatus Campbellbacteria bacterium]|nr:MAG: penicillin-binding protein 2, penicillin-binding protein 2 [Candidatus Campbellbacteria bacterium GW2011_OD1_34_28]KKP74600.1 MAG: Peptidoglycan glycosyltransferase [Candidatus Campbellbacteria bacterium GW2011_GWD2_35_24]KKP76732.1 MAG: Peptidoglycan glycosyltransferase [Candidatus Campbellbacteria bacterium GW2011_GWC1_35_31]KKP78697.1 MAG: Peptidoglycan glycosyltransferase [Candidatus Campbellbacteria bacterium GW2011_GWD1_35_49]HAP74362.1 hypothetical protein [Candidatus Campbellbac
MRLLNRKNRFNGEIDPDEIFLDSSNLPKFNKQQFEGTIEKPIGKKTFFFFGFFFFLVLAIFSSKIFALQIIDGEKNFSKSDSNRLDHFVVFSERGLVYDRNGKELVTNELSSTTEETHNKRSYIKKSGLSHVLGYVTYPQKDSSGNYYETKTIGRDGVEKIFDEKLNGKNGTKLIEVDALGQVISEAIFEPSIEGENITLSIDSELQAYMYETIRTLANRVHFTGGAGVIMDVTNGEILALTNYPEYSSDVLSNSEDNNLVAGYIFDEGNPFLNRVTSGLYIPGSIVKPFMSLGVLNEGLIDPKKQILSTGSISIQNPYNPDQKTVFKDWKAHGWVDMRQAIAVSSDVYFYAVGGGYGDQKGLGITKINEYMKMFGFGKPTEAEVTKEEIGNVPNPEWKKENFEGEDWTLGNTYHTSIGQYGFQVTPLQAVRATASVANNGYLLKPTFIKDSELNKKYPERIPIDLNNFKIVKEGMRQAVTEGTAQGLSVPYTKVAGKTGTAELGVSKKYVNAWIIGFFPYENPKYAFAVIMEHGPKENTVGGLYVMRQTLDWMSINRPEYFK